MMSFEIFFILSLFSLDVIQAYTDNIQHMPNSTNYNHSQYSQLQQKPGSILPGSNEEEIMHIQVQISPLGNNGPLFPQLPRIFHHSHTNAGFSEVDIQPKNENDTSTEPKVVTRRIYTSFPQGTRNLVIESTNEEFEVPLLGPLFRILTGSNSTTVQSKFDQNSENQETKMTVQVQHPNSTNKEELEVQFENLGKNLESTLHDLTNGLSNIFHGLQSEDASSNKTEMKTESKEAILVPIPPTENEAIDTKVQDLEKKLAQILGKVEKLENENGRLKKIVSSLINGN